jgi:hypothetical protein
MANYAQLGLTGRALKEVGITAAKMTILLENSQVDIANGSLEGTIFVSYEDSKSNFVARYKKRYELTPDLGADTGYDILYVYLTQRVEF